MKESEILAVVEEKADRIAELLKINKPSYELDADENGDLVVYVNFEGEKMGFLIGPHGQHLQSFQFILSLMVRKQLPEDVHVSIIVDAGGYTMKRMEQIADFAMKKAEELRLVGGSIDLDPMGAFERKVVHTTMSKIEDISTESFGEGRDRFVRMSIVGSVAQVADEENPTSTTEIDKAADEVLEDTLYDDNSNKEEKKDESGEENFNVKEEDDRDDEHDDDNKKDHDDDDDEKREKHHDDDDDEKHGEDHEDDDDDEKDND